MKQMKGAAVGAGISLLLYLALLALGALLLVHGTVDESHTGVCVWIAALIAALVGSKAAAYRAEQPLVRISACGAAFYLTVLLTGFLIHDTLSPSRAAALVLPVLTGCAISALFGRGGKRSRGGKRPARRSRK